MKNMLFLSALYLVFALPAFARDVRSSECIGPAGAPVKAIYIHGLVPQNGAGWGADLESTNRAKLEELAAKLKIRIAVPLAPLVTAMDKKGNPRKDKNGNPIRRYDWQLSGLSAAEKKSEQVCKAPLSASRSLIGFSAGGYLARNAALGCDAHLKKQYTNVIMIGAKARTPEYKKNNPRRFAGCPKFTFIMGTSDPTGSSGSSAMVNAYNNMGGQAEEVSFQGGHVLPTSLVEQHLEKTVQTVELQTPQQINQNSNSSTTQ